MNEKEVVDKVEEVLGGYVHCKIEASDGSYEIISTEEYAGGEVFTCIRFVGEQFESSEDITVEIVKLIEDVGLTVKKVVPSVGE